ncbi:unnamed protein product [Symbiodinium sp. CCMP2456]|nr:unnamed protein product [Symbiodinium sp. CCMP2456]
MLQDVVWQLQLALAQQETAQAQVGTAQAQVLMATKKWEDAAQAGDMDTVKEAQQEVKEAEQKVKEAEQKVKEAKQEVKEAKQEVEKAKQEVEKAEQKVEKAKQQVKEMVQKVEVASKDFDIAACTRPPIKVRPSHFVQLAPCVSACIEAVNKRLPEQTEATSVRVPPAVLSRCMRGGKTTVLMHVFDELKEKSKNPIFISFNGDSLIRQLENESCLETMLRAIAVALLTTKPAKRDETARILCRQNVLEEYLKDKKDVVLIVDELNVLLKPDKSDDGYAEVGAFLREQFLDPSGRYLIFSTHVPTGIGLSHLLGKGSGSTRTAETIEMPRSHDMPSLRSMGEQCEALTPCEAAYYGRIPSLVYSVKMPRSSFNILERFQAVECGEPTQALIESFLSEFFTGVRSADSDPIRAFDTLTECPASGRIRWILAYVGQMCSHLGLSEIAGWVDEIPRLSEKVDSGLDWEAIVLVALSLRCVQAKYNYVHPLLNLPEGAVPVKDVFLKKVPQDWCKTLPDMVKWWKRRTVSPDAFPYIAVLSPNFAKTEVVDAAWIYKQDSASNCVVRGVQMKLGRTVPSMPHDMLGLVMRGRAPSTGKRAKGWVYPSSGDIRDFLGASLSALYPSDWPRAVEGTAAGQRRSQQLRDVSARQLVPGE